MSLELLSTYGKNLMLETSGATLLESEKILLEELKPRSIIFRARNFEFKKPYLEWLEAFKKLRNDIKACVGSEKILWTIDHEGGRVIRPPLPITRFPYAVSWRERTAEVAEAMAIELKSLGINVSFAPVADINSNPNNPVIGARAFSNTADEVIKFAGLFHETLVKNGVLSCAKHFPGHGDTNEDTHFSLPAVDRSLNELHNLEFKPFCALIEKNIPMIMTAHIVLKQIDPNNQATLSKAILTDILRKEFKFDGVIIADALGMHAIKGNETNESVAKKGIEAGLDLFCLAGDSVNLNDAKAIAETLRSLVLTKQLDEEIIVNSHQRIDRVLSQAKQFDVCELDLSYFDSHARLAHELDPNDEYKNFQYIPKGFD